MLGKSVALPSERSVCEGTCLGFEEQSYSSRSTSNVVVDSWGQTHTQGVVRRGQEQATLQHILS